MTHPEDCADLARELDVLYADPITVAYGVGGEMAPLVRDRHIAKCARRVQEAPRDWESVTFPDAPRVPESQLTRPPNEGGTLLVGEASTIGLPPGSWPAVIIVELAARGMEPSLPAEFQLLSVLRDRDGDVTHAEYATPLRSLFLQVWND